MGLYASYYPISPNTLNNFIASVHSKDFWKVMYAVRGHEFPAPDGSVRLEPHLPFCCNGNDVNRRAQYQRLSNLRKANNQAA